MQSETEYFRRVYEATYEDMLRYAVLHFVIGRREYRLCPTAVLCKTPTQGFSAS